MRVVVHDYVGYAFPAQLARALARRGHDVLHLHCSSFVSGKGRLERQPNDPEGLAFESVVLPEAFAKYDVRKRLVHERATGRELTERVVRFDADVVLSANTPLVVQRALLSACRARGIGFVFWQQDVISAAARRVLGRRFFRLAGAAAGSAAALLEGRLLRQSDRVVVISEDFLPLLRRWGVDESRVDVIENWAPLDELPVRDRVNAWSAEQGLDGRAVFLYSGTLGFKHDPRLLLELARWAGERDALVVVVSEGPGADWLARHGSGEPALRILGYQPYERLPDVLASADVLVALLEAGAGRFSVPSKVLTYLCAGRPVIAAVAPENLAARVLERSGAGVVVPPTGTAALLAAAADLLADPDRREELGKRGRAYAEATFDVEVVAARFEAVGERASSSAVRAR